MLPVHPSRAVTSSQETIHPRLKSVVATHLSKPWRQPLHRPSVEAFEALQVMLPVSPQRLVLDAGCGTGESTRLLAARYPQCTVLGVDKSLSRLAVTGADTFPHREGNAIWLRADLASFWRLARSAGWRLERHFLLYPNPWPKPTQLRRRWHAHPVFPELLALGGKLELRCNWKIYAQEFSAAINQALGLKTHLMPVLEAENCSPFERKYRNSGHSLYLVSADLTRRGDPEPG